MSEESNELVTSYQRIRKQLDQQSAENKILTEKVNSLVMLLEAEKAERAQVERAAIVEKINAIHKDFKPTDEMDATALKWILKGLEIAPKSNAKKESSEHSDEINPQPDVPKINGKPIPEDMLEFVAKREDTSRIYELIGGSVE